MSHKKFGPDRFSRFGVYWIQTNRHTDRQAKFIYRLSFTIFLNIYMISDEEGNILSFLYFLFFIFFLFVHRSIIFWLLLKRTNITLVCLRTQAVGTSSAFCKCWPLRRYTKERMWFLYVSLCWGLYLL